MGAKNADARSDLWSLGVVLYEAMSGRTPHADCDTIGSLLVAICTRAPRPLAEVAPWVPPPVAAIVHKALSIDLALRFQSGAEMRAAVTALLPGGAQLNARLLEQPAGSGAEAGLAGTLLAPLAAGVTPQASTGGAWMSGTPQRGGLPGRVRTSSSRAVRLSVLTSVGAAAILALVFGAFRLAARDRVGAREVPLPTSAPSVTVTVATEEHAAPLPSLDPSPPPLAQLTEVVPSITQRPRPAKRPDAGLQVSSPKKADPPAEPNASLNHGKDRCDDEDVSGCFALGVTYEAGFDGVTKSYPHALEAYRRGCARGNPACCTRVGEVLKEEAQP
jgi:serine/threonine-protein kinase